MGLSERMTTGQPPGAKRAAMLSARTPAQSRNVTPAKSKTSPLGPVIDGQGHLFQEPASLGKIQVTAQDESADRSIANGA